MGPGRWLPSALQASRAGPAGCWALRAAGSPHPRRARGHRPRVPPSRRYGRTTVRSVHRPIDSWAIRASGPNRSGQPAPGATVRSGRLPASGCAASATNLDHSPRRPLGGARGAGASAAELDRVHPRQAAGRHMAILYCHGSCGVQALEVGGTRLSAEYRNRGPARRDSDALASAGAPRGVDEAQLQIVKHFLEEMALLIGPIAVGLDPEQRKEVDRFLGLFQIEHSLTFRKVGPPTEIHESRAREHDEESPEIRTLWGRSRRSYQSWARGLGARWRRDRLARPSGLGWRARGRVIVGGVATPSVTDLEGFIVSHGMSSSGAARA